MSNPFISIWRKEFYALISGWLGFFILLVYLVLSLGMCFFAGDFFRINNQALFSFFRFQPEILALLVPAVSMPLWTDESRRGTIDFLLSQPVKYATAIMAKFAAAWSFGAVMLLCTLPLAFVSSFYIRLDWQNIVLAYVAVWLVIGAFAAVGSVISALSSNPVLTYVCSFFCAWMLLELNPSVLFSWVARRFKGQVSVVLDFRSEYADMIAGQLALNNLIYFGLIIILSLWLNVVIIANKKN